MGQGNCDVPDLDGLLEIGSVLRRIELTIGQASALAGITPRQLAYWTQRGIIPSRKSAGKAQAYDLESLRKVLVVKRLMDRGLTLSRAVAVAERILARRETIEVADKDGISVLGEDQAQYGDTAGVAWKETPISGDGALHSDGIEERLLRRISAFEERVMLLEERLARIERTRGEADVL